MKVALAVLVLVTRVSHAAPLAEQPLDTFPHGIRQVVARPGGGAYILGADPQIVSQAIELDASSTPQRAELPAGIGVAFHVTTELDWMIGAEGVARHEAGAWRVVESFGAARAAPGSRVVRLTDASVLVVRPAPNGTLAYELAADGVRTAELEVSGVVVRSVVPDGFGGAWGIVEAPSAGLVGYTKYERGVWTLWRSQRAPRRSLAGFRLVERVPYGDLTVLAPDGNGGCVGASDHALFRIDASGGIRKLARLAEPVRGIAYDRVLDQVHAFSWPYASEVAARLVRFDREGRMLASDPLAVPSVAPFRPTPDWSSIAADAGHVWIAVAYYLYRLERGTWTVFYNGPIARREAADRERDRIAAREARADRGGTSGIATVIVTPLALATGTLVVSAGTETAPRAAIRVTAGAIGALGPAILLDEAAQYFDAESVQGRVAAALLATTGFTGATLLGALGTWGAGALDGDPARGKQFGGAVLGAAVGTLLSTQGLKLLRRKFPAQHGMRLGIAASVIGTAAAVGYQATR